MTSLAQGFVPGRMPGCTLATTAVTVAKAVAVTVADTGTMALVGKIAMVVIVTRAKTHATKDPAARRRPGMRPAAAALPAGTHRAPRRLAAAAAAAVPSALARFAAVPPARMAMTPLAWTLRTPAAERTRLYQPIVLASHCQVMWVVAGVLTAVPTGWVPSVLAPAPAPVPAPVSCTHCLLCCSLLLCCWLVAGMECSVWAAAGAALLLLLGLLLLWLLLVGLMMRGLWVARMGWA